MTTAARAPSAAPQAAPRRPAPPPPARTPAGPGSATLPPGRGSGRLLAAVFVAAAGLLAYTLAHHVMWFDELQAWNIARASHSLGALDRNLRYEGHPFAWYLVLYTLTRFTGDPRAMQVVEFGIVAGSYALILFRSPFSVAVRVTLVAGYCLSFEYGIISRGYGLGVLALLLVLVALARPRPAWGAALAAATLLAWTSLAGAVVAVALAGAVALDREHRGSRRFVLGTLLVSTGSAFTCLPPSDFHTFTPSLGNFATVGGDGVTRVVDATTGIWRGLVPLPARLGGWNSQLLDRLPAAPWLEAAASIGLFALVLAALPRDRSDGGSGASARRRRGSSSSSSCCPTRLATPASCSSCSSPRCGSRPRPPGGRRPHRPRVGRRRGVCPGSWSPSSPCRSSPCSPWRRASRCVPSRPTRRSPTRPRAAHLEDTIVSGEDFDATAVGGYLDRPSYSVARRAWIRFFVHDDLEARRRAALRTDATVCAAAELAGRLRRPAGLITQATPAGPGVARVALDQHVALYRVVPAAAHGCPPAPPPPAPPSGST